MDDTTSEKGKETKGSPARPPQPRVMQTAKHLPSTVKKHFEEISDLRPERVKWFYQEDKKWTPFCGLDSLRIEQCYRGLPKEAKTLPEVFEICTVRGGLYDVDAVKRICKPVYWKGEDLSLNLKINLSSKAVDRGERLNPLFFELGPTLL